MTRLRSRRANLRRPCPLWENGAASVERQNLGTDSALRRSWTVAMQKIHVTHRNFRLRLRLRIGLSRCIIRGAADGYPKSSQRRDRRYQPCHPSSTNQLRIICQPSSFENPRVQFAGRISTNSLNWTTTFAVRIQTALAGKKRCLRDVMLRKSQGLTQPWISS